MNPIYLAGIIDGEGCIMIAKHGTHYNPVVTVTNTNLALLTKIVETFGGTIRLNGPKREKQVYKVEWHSNAIRKVLPLVIDHLLVKREQAELVLEYLSFRKKGKHIRSPKEREFRERVVKLNK